MNKVIQLANLNNLNKSHHSKKKTVHLNLKINNLKFKKLKPSSLRLHPFSWMKQTSPQLNLPKKPHNLQILTQNLKQISHNNHNLLLNNLHKNSQKNQKSIEDLGPKQELDPHYNKKMKSWVMNHKNQKNHKRLKTKQQMPLRLI